MTEYPKDAERFANDTDRHELTILHDDGIYRHLRFREPSHGFYWFDLITWPGCLTVLGDFGDAYTFTREPDMFTFFRSRTGRRINPHYWAQKLDGSRDAAETYSEDAFRSRVIEAFVDAARWDGVPPGTGKALRAEVLNNEYVAWEEEARKALEDFEYGAKFKASCTCGKSEEFAEELDAVRWRSTHIEPGHRAHVSKVERIPGFSFSDVWEWDFKAYSWHFLWACHAIVWGIRRYDRVTRYGLKAVAS